MAEPSMADPSHASPAHRRRSMLLSVSAFALLWVALLVPDSPDGLSAAFLLRIPVELLVLTVLALVLPRRAAARVAGILGVTAAVVILLKVLDIGFLAGFYRDFDPLSDPAYLGSGWGLLHASVGPVAAVLAGIGVVLATLGLLVGLPAAAVRVTRVARRHRAVTTAALGVLTLAWAAGAAASLDVARGLPTSAADTSTTALKHVQQIQDGLRDRADFQRAAADDPYAAVPPQALLAGLRGKDVVVVFVESYGRVAVQDPVVSPPVTAALDRAATGLGALGFTARSAFLTSPTFGGLSWLAHSTLQTGLRISDQVRYNAVISSSRLTLSTAFRRAGWHTVVDSPADEQDFAPASDFYGYQTVYDARNVGYAGPTFGYAPIPDQYTLATLATRELRPGLRPPVFAEVDLVSSHAPWAPLPRMIDPRALGDGSPLRKVLTDAPSVADVWRDTGQVRQAYAQSVAYALDALTSFVEAAHDDNLVLVILGDHQPAAVVSGSRPDHDVPVTLVAHDPAVLGLASTWGWQPGWRPAPDAVTWPMEAFRDRFLDAFRSPVPPGS